jgi:hypothetical protein
MTEFTLRQRSLLFEIRIYYKSFESFGIQDEMRKYQRPIAESAVRLQVFGLWQTVSQDIVINLNNFLRKIFRAISNKL